MPEYIVDDRTGEINQIGPFEAEDIYQAFSLLANYEFVKFYNAGVMEQEIVDEDHGYIVINLPGGARYEYEVGEVETEPAEQSEDENAERSTKCSAF